MGSIAFSWVCFVVLVSREFIFEEAVKRFFEGGSDLSFVGCYPALGLPIRTAFEGVSIGEQQASTHSPRAKRLERHQ
jgi:hypothetical protein